MSVSSFDEITTNKHYKPLLVRLKSNAGRNNQGRITTRHRGGGHRRMYRIIDFKRKNLGVAGTVTTIEYDPNRSARIALVTYVDGAKKYIVAPLGLKVGESVMSGPTAEVKVGNCLPLANIPLGTVIHNIELQPGRGGQLVRSAGGIAQLLAKEGLYTQVRLPSGEVRRVLATCMASIGQVSNPEHENVSAGKAGRSRWKGRRPSVRGSVMNPRDHPHGGGEGRAPIGGQPKTPWGRPAMGYRTRRNKKTYRMIVRRAVKK